MEAAMLSIRQARDLLLTRNHELIAELARADDKIAELDFDNEEARTARDAAVKERDAHSTEAQRLLETLMELHRQVAVLTTAEQKYVSEAAEAQRAIAELTEELNATRARVPETGAENTSPGQKRDVAILAGQFAAAQQARAVAIQALEQSKAETSRLTAERDALRAELAALRATNEQQIAALRGQVAAIHAQPVSTGPEKPAPVESSANTSRAAAPADASSTEPLTGPDAITALETMRECLALLATHPDNLNLLEAFDNHLRSFSERAHAAEMAAVHRYSLGCREMTRWLRKAPGKIPATLPTLHEALELLTALTSLPDGTAIADPAGALVYSVDDDADNCECISAALEKVTLYTKYATKPDVALAELAAIPCDLIILDVNIPDMDGFEICARVREMEHHRDTPILFVSGLTSARERIASIKNQHVEFVAKPYNLTELSVKALSMILRGQIPQPAQAFTVV